MNAELEKMVQAARKWRRKNDVRIVCDYDNPTLAKPYTIEQVDVMLAEYGERVRRETLLHAAQLAYDKKGMVAAANTYRGRIGAPASFACDTLGDLEAELRRLAEGK